MSGHTFIDWVLFGMVVMGLIGLGIMKLIVNQKTAACESKDGGGPPKF